MADVLVTNPTHLNWVNPATGIDQDGNAIAWNPATDMKGIEVQFDNGSAVEVDCGNVQTLLLASVPGYTALANGTHKIDMAILTNEGKLSGFTTSVTFQRATFITPDQPTNVNVA